MTILDVQSFAKTPLALGSWSRRVKQPITSYVLHVQRHVRKLITCGLHRLLWISQPYRHSKVYTLAPAFAGVRLEADLPPWQGLSGGRPRAPASADGGLQRPAHGRARARRSRREAAGAHRREGRGRRAAAGRSAGVLVEGSHRRLQPGRKTTVRRKTWDGPFFNGHHWKRIGGQQPADSHFRILPVRLRIGAPLPPHRCGSSCAA